MLKLDEVQQFSGMPVYLNTTTSPGETPPPPPEENAFIMICSNGIYRFSRTEYLAVMKRIDGIPSGSLNEGRDGIAWVGPKLSLDDFYWARDIFLSVYDDIKTECDIQLEYSQQLGKFILHLPHQVVSSAHVSWEERDDDPYWIDQKLVAKKDLPEDVMHIGRIHSHNTMSAFWSGTDTGDQERQEFGIQIVMGRITTALEWQCRVCYSGKYIDVKLEDIVDIPPRPRLEIPKGIITTVASSGTTYSWTQSAYSQSSVKPAGINAKGTGTANGTGTGGDAQKGTSFHQTGESRYDDEGAGEDTYSWENYERACGGDTSPFRPAREQKAGSSRKGGRRVSASKSGNKGAVVVSGSVDLLSKRRGRPAKNKTVVNDKTPAYSEEIMRALMFLHPGIVGTMVGALDSDALSRVIGELAQDDDMLAMGFDHSASDAEMRRVLSFSQFHDYVVYGVNGLYISEVEESGLEVLVESTLGSYASGVHPTADDDFDTMKDILRSSALDLSQTVYLFKTWFPTLSGLYDKVLQSRSMSLDDLAKVVWEPAKASNDTMYLLADMLLECEEVSKQLSMPLFPYCVAGKFEVKNTSARYYSELIARRI